MSPVKSKRQWRQIWHLVETGELTEEKAREMTAGQRYKDLPERVKKKRRKKRK